MSSAPRNSDTQHWKWTDKDSLRDTGRKNPPWLSSRDSKTRIPSRVRRKKYSTVEWKDRVSKRTNLFSSSRRRTTSTRSPTHFSCWRKIGIFVKLTSKASVKWKNWCDFMAQGLTKAQVHVHPTSHAHVSFCCACCSSLWSPCCSTALHLQHPWCRW